LKSLQLFSYERLRMAMRDLFGLTISEGALMNMFKRTKPAFEAKRTQALTALRQARFVASDETGSRIEGVNAYQWSSVASRPSWHAAASVAARKSCATFSTAIARRVWTSDRYSASRATPTGSRPVLPTSPATPASPTKTARTMRRFACACGSIALLRWPADIETVAVSTMRAKRRALEQRRHGDSTVAQVRAQARLRNRGSRLDVAAPGLAAWRASSRRRRFRCRGPAQKRDRTTGAGETAHRPRCFRREAGVAGEVGKTGLLPSAWLCWAE